MATYETFAAVYDAVMDDSLYDLWTDFSLRHLPKTKDKKKLLELACGTGIQSVRFSQAGFDVTGLDLSADMLKIAEKRASSAKQKIDFIEGNMLDLSQAGKYDFVTCYSKRFTMLSMRMASSSLMCTQPIRRMRFSLAIPTMKMQKTLLCFGIPMRMRHQILLFMK